MEGEATGGVPLVGAGNVGGACVGGACVGGAWAALSPLKFLSGDPNPQDLAGDLIRDRTFTEKMEVK